MNKGAGIKKDCTGAHEAAFLYEGSLNITLDDGGFFNPFISLLKPSLRSNTSFELDSTNIPRAK